MALKVIRKSRSQQMGQSVQEILAEAQVLAQLRHPCVVALHEVVDCGDLLVLAMDYATGGDLSILLRKFGRLHEGAVRAITYNILEGLAFLHGRGCLHRDLKPANVLLMGGPIAEENEQALLRERRQKARATAEGNAPSMDSISSSSELEGSSSSSASGHMRMTVICRDESAPQSIGSLDEDGLGPEAGATAGSRRPASSSSSSASSASSSMQPSMAGLGVPGASDSARWGPPPVSTVASPLRGSVDAETGELLGPMGVGSGSSAGSGHSPASSDGVTVTLPHYLPDMPRAMLSDFGLSTVLGQGEMARSHVGTPVYLSPEQIAHTCLGLGKGYGWPSDMWATGVMIYQLLTGRLPWDIRKGARPVQAQILDCYKRRAPPSLSYPSDVSRSARDLIHRLLSMPAERPTAQQAMQHAWFKVGTTKQGGGLKGKPDGGAAAAAAASSSPGTIGGRLRVTRSESLTMSKDRTVEHPVAAKAKMVARQAMRQAKKERQG